jgi:hypothetical protein
MSDLGILNKKKYASIYVPENALCLVKQLEFIPNGNCNKIEWLFDLINTTLNRNVHHKDFNGDFEKVL